MLWFDNLITFIELGFRHILPMGLDHVLFITAMYLGSTTWRSLVIQVTAFTLAHTLSLALTVLGVIEPPPGLVEPLIAVSIVIVALLALRKETPATLTLPVILLFGLLHGLGFAGVIRGYLEGAELVTGLIGFNLGVELGQLAVIVMLGALTATIKAVLSAIGKTSAYRTTTVIPATITIAAIGTAMLLSRLHLADNYLPAL